MQYEADFFLYFMANSLLAVRLREKLVRIYYVYLIPIKETKQQKKLLLNVTTLLAEALRHNFILLVQKDIFKHTFL